MASEWILNTLIILSTSECTIYLQVLCKSVELFLSEQRKCGNLTKYRLCHPIRQMDLSCPQTIRNEICQKCRETIPLVQVCFRFESSLTVLKLLSKIWVNPWNFDEIFAVLAFFSARWRQMNFKTIGLFKLHQNTQFLKIWWESVE